ncbi:Om45 [Kluyveromyces lactis]|nr:Om45 [Kluyveromyces lactis]
MSNRVIIGGVAVAAAGYLLYERQVQLKQQQNGAIPVSPVVHDQSTFERKGAKTGAKLDDLTTDVKDKMSQYKNEADYKFQDIASQVEGKKAGIADWTVEKLDQAKNTLEDSRDKYRDNKHTLRENVQEYENKDKPNAVVQVYKDTKGAISTDLGNIKEGFIDDLKSVKSAIVGTGNQVQDTVQQNVNEIADKGSQKIDDTKESVSKAAASSKQTVNEAAQNAKDTSVSILNWGYNKAEKARAQAINNYDNASKKYQELEERFNESKKGLFGKGDPELQRQVDQAKAYVEDAKRRVDEATREFSEKTTNDFNKLANQVHDNEEELRRKGFLSWLRGKADTEVVDPDSIASHSVSGWGETAELLAKEEMEEKVRNRQIGPSEAQRRLDRFKKIKEDGWFTYKGKDEEFLAQKAAKALEGWGETASTMAQEEYEDLVRWREAGKKRYQASASTARDDAQKAADAAKKSLEDARAELNKHTKHWWQFGVEKNEELQKAAKAKYEDAEKNYQSAVNTVNDWADKATGKFWSSTDDALHTAKQAAAGVHESTQKGLDKAQNYVQEKK